ncbi:hypothetical protein NL676_008303 [Syzygium grande]|nr:hypothetical protein NL676_008303 [Syzygium grande]
MNLPPFLHPPQPRTSLQHRRERETVGLHVATPDHLAERARASNCVASSSLSARALMMEFQEKQLGQRIWWKTARAYRRLRRRAESTSSMLILCFRSAPPTTTSLPSMGGGAAAPLGSAASRAPEAMARSRGGKQI